MLILHSHGRVPSSKRAFAFYRCRLGVTTATMTSEWSSRGCTGGGYGGGGGGVGGGGGGGGGGGDNADVPTQVHQCRQPASVGRERTYRKASTGPIDILARRRSIKMAVICRLVKTIRRLTLPYITNDALASPPVLSVRRYTWLNIRPLA